MREKGTIYQPLGMYASVAQYNRVLRGVAILEYYRPISEDYLMSEMEEQLNVKVPTGWKKKLDDIGKPDDRDKSYLTRKALEKTYPQLKEVRNA